MDQQGSHDVLIGPTIQAARHSSGVFEQISHRDAVDPSELA
jgi:hypothetical protein